MASKENTKFRKRKEQLMEDCFNCYAEKGLHGTGIAALADAAGVAKSTFYDYFENLDDLIVQSTAYCMMKVEDEFMQKAPNSTEELWDFIDQIPYWTAENHGKKYRLMYQVYTHPKYRAYGQEFFAGVDKRYAEYAKKLERKVKIPADILTPLIFILIRAAVHYALFEDEFYLKSQLRVLKQGIRAFVGDRA